MRSARVCAFANHWCGRRRVDCADGARLGTAARVRGAGRGFAASARLGGLGAGATGVDDEGRGGHDGGLPVRGVVDHPQAGRAPFSGHVQHQVAAAGAVAVVDVGVIAHDRVDSALRAPRRGDRGAAELGSDGRCCSSSKVRLRSQTKAVIARSASRRPRGRDRRRGRHPASAPRASTHRPRALTNAAPRHVIAPPLPNARNPLPLDRRTPWPGG